MMDTKTERTANAIKERGAMLEHLLINAGHMSNIDTLQAVQAIVLGNPPVTPHNRPGRNVNPNMNNQAWNNNGNGRH